MLKEVIILVDEGLDEEGGLLRHGEVRRQHVRTELSEETLTSDDLMHVLVVLTGLTD
jgi:hypothetical protein